MHKAHQRWKTCAKRMKRNKLLGKFKKKTTSVWQWPGDLFSDLGHRIIESISPHYDLASLPYCLLGREPQKSHYNSY